MRYKVELLGTYKSITELWVFYVNFNKFCQCHFFSLYIKFIRIELDYAEIIYDQAYNLAFHDKLESVHYNACLAINDAIRSISTTKIYRCLLKKALSFFKDIQ